MEEKKYKWQHSFVVGIYAIPCILLTAVLISPGVLGAIALGYLLCCITSKIQSLHLTTGIVIITFGIAEMLILYEILPLLWLSGFNMALVFLLHGFLGHTGLWFIIEFGVPIVQFEVIEVFLFSTYPAMCSLLYTWFLSSITDIHYTPYFLAFINFVIFQLCAKPRVASITVKEKPQPILDPSIVGCIMLVQCVFPMLLYGVKTLAMSPRSIVTIPFFFEGYFIFAQSVFLSTLLPVKSFIEAMTIPRSRIVMLRWVSGSSSLMLLLPILRQYGFETELMSSLKWKLILYILLVAVMPNKKRRTVSAVLSALLIFVYLWQINDLPWSLRYPGMELFTRFSVSTVQFLYFALGLNLCLSVASIWTYIYCNRRTFSITFSLFSTVFLILEWMMYTLYIAPRYGLVLSSPLFFYTIYILSRNDRLLHWPCVLCLALVSGKLVFLSCHWLEGHRMFYGMTSFGLVIPVICALFHILLLPDISNLFNTFTKIGALCGSVTVPMLLLHQPLFAPLIWDVFSVELSRIHLIGLSSILIGACLSRSLPISTLSLFERMCGPLAVAYGFIVILIRLYFSNLWSVSLCGCLLGVIVGTWLLIHQTAQMYQRHRILLVTIISLLLGTMLSFVMILVWEIPVFLVMTNLLLNSCTAAMIFLCFCFPTLLQYQYVPSLFHSGLVLFFLQLVTSLYLSVNEMPALLSAAIFSMTTALTLKLSEDRRKNDEVVLNLTSLSSFAGLINISVLIFFCVGLMAFKFDFSNPLLPFLTLALFLLQRTKLGLDRLTSANQHIPPLSALSFILTGGVFVQSPCLFPADSTLRYWQYYLLLRAWAELAACVILLPIHFIYLNFHWCRVATNRRNGASLMGDAVTFERDRPRVSVQRVYPHTYYMLTVFLIPLCLVFLLGTSYTAYLYGAYSAFLGVSILLNNC